MDGVVDVVGSVTRLGKISPFWQYIVADFFNVSKVLFSIWQYFEPMRAKHCSWAMFHYFKWPNIEK